MYPETITSSYCLIDKLTGMTSQTVVVSSFIVGIHTTNVGSHQEIELVVEEDDSVPDIDRLKPEIVSQSRELCFRSGIFDSLS